MAIHERISLTVLTGNVECSWKTVIFLSQVSTDWWFLLTKPKFYDKMQLDDVLVRNCDFLVRWRLYLQYFDFSIFTISLWLKSINQQTLKVGYVQNGEKFR